MNNQSQKKKAFSIAGAVSPTILKEIRTQLNSALVTGISFKEFSKQMKLAMKVES